MAPARQKEAITNKVTSDSRIRNGFAMFINATNTSKVPWLRLLTTAKLASHAMRGQPDEYR